MKHFSGWRIDVARLRGVSEEEAPPPLPVAATATLPAFFIALLKESGLRAVRAAALVLLLLLMDSMCWSRQQLAGVAASP